MTHHFFLDASTRLASRASAYSGLGTDLYAYLTRPTRTGGRLRGNRPLGDHHQLPPHPRRPRRLLLRRGPREGWPQAGRGRRGRRERGVLRRAGQRHAGLSPGTPLVFAATAPRASLKTNCIRRRILVKYPRASSMAANSSCCSLSQL